MHAVRAQVQPHKVGAVYEVLRPPPHLSRTERQRQPHRAADAQRTGLGSGDAVALVCTNRYEFCEVLSAAMRTGMRITPVNWHLTAEEIAYVVRDCEAKALFADAKVATAPEAASLCPDLTLKVMIGGEADGFVNYEQALAELEPQRHRRSGARLYHALHLRHHRPAQGGLQAGRAADAGVRRHPRTRTTSCTSAPARPITPPR